MKDSNRDVTMAERDQLVLRRTLDIICGKWRLFILLNLGEHTRRYGELRRMMPDVSEKVLIQELKSLISLGVLEKESFSEVPPRVEYRLTTKGRGILPHLNSLHLIGAPFMED
ncbi:transcriptional regulator [Rudanella paleaurantiibacter]|jgi:DNA-binding HxlR family transcriptional regulator|uniref:Transcriptional regulator n=2 Tax=Rudanella TaxID=451373 RepID=A0A7J5TZ20_9BACT|nr:helix-turn-helix domain-containing protein [Rudanella paleaurantiibacter]KAB7730363.1 transcriptional regulator [Rudanella paleaurantiibacter]